MSELLEKKIELLESKVNKLQNIVYSYMRTNHHTPHINYEENSEEIVNHQIKIVKEYWEIFKDLLVEGKIKSCIDLKIEGHRTVKIVSEGIEKVIVFNTIKQILFIRFDKIYPLYVEEIFKRNNITGGIITMSGREEMRECLRNTAEYIGLNKMKRFSNVPTSSSVFDLELIDIITPAMYNQ